LCAGNAVLVVGVAPALRDLFVLFFQTNSHRVEDWETGDGEASMCWV
jgi:hypothetical protein